jgi:hypothetical protein
MLSKLMLNGLIDMDQGATAHLFDTKTLVDLADANTGRERLSAGLRASRERMGVRTKWAARREAVALASRPLTSQKASSSRLWICLSNEARRTRSPRRETLLCRGERRSTGRAWCVFECHEPAMTRGTEDRIGMWQRASSRACPRSGILSRAGDSGSVSTLS